MKLEIELKFLYWNKSSQLHVTVFDFEHFLLTFPVSFSSSELIFERSIAFLQLFDELVFFALNSINFSAFSLSFRIESSKPIRAKFGLSWFLLENSCLQLGHAGLSDPLILERHFSQNVCPHLESRNGRWASL